MILKKFNGIFILFVLLLNYSKQMNNPSKHKKNIPNVEEKPYNEVLVDGTPFKLNEHLFPPLTSEKDKIKVKNF